MSALFGGMIKMLGVIFAVLVLGFTGFQTWSLLHEVSGNLVISIIGLALFEGGMLYWWAIFQYEAEGLGQLALSLLLACFGLLLVMGSTALHLGAVSGDVLGLNTPAKLVTIAAIVNMVGKFAFPLLSPTTFSHIWQRVYTALNGVVAPSVLMPVEED